MSQKMETVMNTNGQNSSPTTQNHQANGNPEIDRLSTLVQKLQTECDELKKALARSQADRIVYLNAVYAHERAKFQLTEADVDFDELKKTSAGPVELIL